MDIKYLGHSCFFIKGKEAKLVMDPFDPKFTGLKFSKIEADIVTVSHQHKDHNNISAVSGSPLVIEWPGQYEKKGMRVYGFRSYHDKKQGAERGENTIFRIEEDLSILHCGDLGYIPDDKFIDEIGEVDVLMVPVGGDSSIEPADAVELIKKIKPSIVIPMHFNRPELNQEIFGKKFPVSEFLKIIGSENIASVQKLTVKKEELGEEMKVVVMGISN